MSSCPQLTFQQPWSRTRTICDTTTSSIEKKNKVLNHKNNTTQLTKRQRYTQIVNGKGGHRKTSWATQSFGQQHTNSNTYNLELNGSTLKICGTPPPTPPSPPTPPPPPPPSTPTPTPPTVDSFKSGWKKLVDDSVNVIDDRPYIGLIQKEFWDYILRVTSLKKTRNYLNNGHYYLFPAENVRDIQYNSLPIGDAEKYGDYEVPSVITIGNIEYKTVSTVGEENLLTSNARYSFIDVISYFQVSYYSIGIYGYPTVETLWDALAINKSDEYKTLWKGFFGYVEITFWNDVIRPIDGTDSNRVGPSQYMYSAEDIDASIPDLVTIDEVEYKTVSTVKLNDDNNLPTIDQLRGSQSFYQVFVVLNTANLGVPIAEKSICPQPIIPL